MILHNFAQLRTMSAIGDTNFNYRSAPFTCLSTNVGGIAKCDDVENNVNHNKNLILKIYV